MRYTQLKKPMMEVELVEMLVHLDEGVLRGVGGGLAIPDHPEGDVEERALMTPNQELESLLVACPAAGHEVGVFCIL